MMVLLAIMAILIQPCVGRGSTVRQESNLSTPQSDDFMSQLQLGDYCEKLGDLDNAIDCYKRATVCLHGGCSDQNELTFALEGALGHRPLDPELHVCLGQTFEQCFVKEKVRLAFWQVAQAEAEYRQASKLWHDSGNATAVVPKVSRHAKSFISRLATAKEAEFKNQIANDWKPPPHEGYMLTRCHLFVDEDGRIRGQPEIAVSSGSKDFDQTALNAVASAPYAKHTSLHIAGLLDFMCASDGITKQIEFVAFGRVSEPQTYWSP